MTDKIQVIEEILERLDAETDGMDGFNRKYRAGIEDIANLPAEYNEVLRVYLRSLYDKMDEENSVEFFFQVALEGLVEKKQHEIAFELASEALLSDIAVDKEFYVKFLIREDHTGTAEVLIKSFPVFESDFDDELDGFGEEEAISYLMLKEIPDAYPAILQFLPDSAPRVRASVLDFIKKFDNEEAAPHLVKQLEVEDWEYNILLILKSLHKWRKTEFLPQLKKYSMEEWVQDDLEVSALLKEIIRDFSMPN